MNIVAFAGRKQSGKNSAANFVIGYTLFSLGLCKQYGLDEGGKLAVQFSDNESDIGILDFERKDAEFQYWAMQNLWSEVKNFALADEMKRICGKVFNIPHECLYGTDEEKNQLIDIKWSSMFRFLPPRTVGEMKRSGKYDRNMTAREFMQYFGTEVCRFLKGDCWVQNCVKDIQQYGSKLSLITDVRFVNEIELLKEYGAKIIYFTRCIDDSSHASESEIGGVDKKYLDFIVDNQDMDILDKSKLVLDKLHSWGYVN